MKKRKSLVPARVGRVLGRIATLLLLVSGLLFASRARRMSPAPPSQLRIMSWGNLSPQWQQTLHVSGLRIGCSSPPQSCMRYVSSINPRNKVFLSTVLRLDTVNYGQQYSSLSRQDPSLEEIDLDDFVSQYWKLGKTVKDPSTVLETFIDGVKSQNANLHFGATIYEDDLGTQYLSDRDLPPALRTKFDTVHFFIHFRGDTPRYEEYVQQLKTLFPNAKIIGGVYSYDRISYVPCLPKGQTCSPQQEMDYFQQSLDTTTKLLKQGTIAWIEIFPGIFGQEANWSDWSHPHLCPDSRRAECVANTKKMDDTVVARIGQLFE